VKRNAIRSLLLVFDGTYSYTTNATQQHKPQSVAAVVRYQGTGKATGKALDLPDVHVWDIRDGKLARFRQFIDTVKFAEVPDRC
jgi:ketosteroid isomerase-like protein